MNCAPANVSLRVLRETFLFTFKEALRKSGAISVMPSYNEVDGVPSHANKWLLRDVLRKEFGFKGFTVSDYFAIWELGYRPDTHGHFVADDKKESCRLAVEAGVNIELPDPDCYLHLVELVKKRVLKESQLDDLVAPMLLWKFKLGLFDDPYVDPDRGRARRRLRRPSQTGPPGRARSHHAAEERRRTRAARSRASTGPSRSSVPMQIARLLGGYSGVPKQEVTVLDGIKAHVGNRAKVLLQRRLQDHHRRQLESGRSYSQQSGRRPQADRRGGRSRQAGRCHYSRHRRQRADLARSLGPEPHGRPRQPGLDRTAG